MLVIGYLLACFLVALSGLNRRCGFVGALFLSLVITPILAFLVLWLTGPVRTKTVAVRASPPSPTPR